MVHTWLLDVSSLSRTPTSQSETRLQFIYAINGVFVCNECQCRWPHQAAEADRMICDITKLTICNRWRLIAFRVQGRLTVRRRLPSRYAAFDIDLESRTAVTMNLDVSFLRFRSALHAVSPPDAHSNKEAVNTEPGIPATVHGKVVSIGIWYNYQLPPSSSQGKATCRLLTRRWWPVIASCRVNLLNNGLLDERRRHVPDSPRHLDETKEVQASWSVWPGPDQTKTGRRASSCYQARDQRSQQEEMPTPSAASSDDCWNQSVPVKSGRWKRPNGYAQCRLCREVQGCSFVFSCEGLRPHKLGQRRHAMLNFREKVCQIRREIKKLKDFDGFWAGFPGSAPTTCFEKLRPWVGTYHCHHDALRYRQNRY